MAMTGAALEMESGNVSLRQAALPALILVDSSCKPICYNAEAVRVLTYPQDPGQFHFLTKHIATKLGPVSSQFRLPNRPPGEVTIQSGRRHYVARMFTFSNYRRTPASTGSLYPAHALLLERQNRNVVDLCTVAEQFHLTPREKQTLQLLMEGLTSKEIAHRMSISPHTVKTFLRLVTSKMQVTGRTEILGKILTLNY
jgi:DNA-binding CsgD family transcriptional regulator